jgi:hypothetical protein
MVLIKRFIFHLRFDYIEPPNDLPISHTTEGGVG